MLSPAPNRADKGLFLEIWVDVTASPPYVLMLLGDEAGLYQILDPAQNYTVTFSSSSYDEAKLWLLEDEYERLDAQLLLERMESQPIEIEA